jgi:serine/threonine-protein kinase ATR
MEGISTKILSPSILHQIREHESTGRWTSAQSCWEVKLQQKPDDAANHVGLLRCLRNLGHYGTLVFPSHVHGRKADLLVVSFRFDEDSHHGSPQQSD